MSPSALEDSADRLSMAERLYAQQQADGRGELAVREQSVQAMQRAVADLNQRLDAMRTASEGLAVRAPVGGPRDGPDAAGGRERAPAHALRGWTAWAASSWSCGSTSSTSAACSRRPPAVLKHEGREHGCTSPASTPGQDGRFSVELLFDNDPPPLQVGQGLDVRLTLGEPKPALLLPDRGFYADTGGAWAFVLDADGRHAPRRPLQLGRRADGVIEVLGGLQPGEQVVVSPYRAYAGASALQPTDHVQTPTPQQDLSRRRDRDHGAGPYRLADRGWRIPRHHRPRAAASPRCSASSASLDAPSSGEYWFDGHNVAGWSERQLNTLRRGRIGFVFQSFNLIDDLSVADNIGLALEYGDLPARERRARVAEVMERLGLTHRASHRPSQLSGGQQQRVAIARAIAARPALLLADEPPATWTARTARGHAHPARAEC